MLKRIKNTRKIRRKMHGRYYSQYFRRYAFGKLFYCVCSRKFVFDDFVRWGTPKVYVSACPYCGRLVERNMCYRDRKRAEGLWKRRNLVGPKDYTRIPYKDLIYRKSKYALAARLAILILANEKKIPFSKMFQMSFKEVETAEVQNQI